MLYVCENNLYAAQTAAAATHALSDVAARAAGYGIPGVVVDGNDIFAVYQAANPAVDRARSGGGPTLIECKTYRWRAHTERRGQPDPRDPGEIEAWKRKDPIALLERQLREQGELDDAGLRIMEGEIMAALEAAVAFAEASPFPLTRAGDRRRVCGLTRGADDARADIQRGRCRSHRRGDAARSQDLLHVDRRDCSRCSRSSAHQRIRATPITEAALTGMAIGAAGCGFRPIVDWRQVTFCFVAMDQIVNQAAKIHYMFGGQVTFPILYRAAVGGGGLVAAQHSQSPYSMFMNVAGLKMFLPSTPYDMKGLLKTAIRDNNPVISFESSRLMARKGPVPDEDYTIPLGKADIKREGSDVTVVALAWLVHEALAAAEELAKEGISVEIVDPRTLVPLDTETIRNSVQKTGRLVIADEAGPTAGFSAEVAAVATEDAATFARLKAPVKRVCALQVPIPYSPVLENHVFPDRKRIIAGHREVLPGGRPAAAA